MAKKSKKTSQPAATATPPPAPPQAPTAGAPPPPPAPPVAPAAAAPAAPVPPARIAAPKQNGVSQPGEGTQTRSVWDMADKISKDKGSPATRKEVVDAAAAAGVNSSTATTQFGKWCKFNGYTADRAPGRTAAAPPPPPASSPTAGPTALQYNEGYEAYKNAAAGQNVTNPYTEGSVECSAFVAGWNASYAASQQAAS